MGPEKINWEVHRMTKNKSLRSRIVLIRVLVTEKGKTKTMRIRVKSENNKWLTGWRVNVMGEETECTLKTQTIHMIDKRAIVKTTELFEDRKYGGYYAKGKNPNTGRGSS